MRKVKEVYCHYAGDWLPLGRARTRCPRCGCELGKAMHDTREVDK